RKIDALSEDDRRLLVGAAVQGYEFDAAVVARALAIDAADAEERFEALDSIHGVVRRVAERELPDATLTLRYRFVHVLYQNALYGSLTPSRRASLSAAIANALLAFHGDKSSTIAAELAFLFQAARDWPHAAEHFLKAARNAARIFANRRPSPSGRRALAMRPPTPKSPGRARRGPSLQLRPGPRGRPGRGLGAPG